MLLVQDAQLLMLDEPVAGMSAEEKDETGRLLQRIAADRTVVIVEHDMDFMRAFADSVTVLHAGKVLSEGSVATGAGRPAGAGGLPRAGAPLRGRGRGRARTEAV